ncbi:hypothetical protein FHS51_003820 [Sphingobium wenxiniae]|uniref:hypothetical protein n=1 Tax=Sphingobium wenxiniae (strain DSM 21828 / CGMCC 1.7748 / JZ-1) TaxID=595605 RepID=UPI0008773D55|nr:hypothetical protein [Sphingobium wenxiniae]MBB6193562.1 hypothetical protein [Sphingobium wenxiniae]SCW94079.1 hypothetical protein SAMN02927924_04428 [Sphingobium faniae]
MNRLDVEAIRAQVRALDFTRGTPAEVALWREDDADARANLAIEGMDLDLAEHALFDMLREESVPPPLATAIVLNPHSPSKSLILLSGSQYFRYKSWC